MDKDGDKPFRLSLYARIGWSVGGAGSTVMLYLVNLFLLYFMVTQMGIPSALAGTLLLAGRFYDAGLDIGIGMMSDRTKSRWGRRIPWMAAGCLVSTIGTMAVFAPPVFGTGLPALIQLGIALAVFFLGYSMFSVPSSAMPAEMTTDYDERTSLMSYRTFFLQLAGVVGAAGAPFLVKELGGGRDAYTTMGVAAAIFVGLTMSVTVMASRYVRRTAYVTIDKMPKREWILSVFGNKPFVILLGVKFCGYIAVASTGAATLFFMGDVLKRGPDAVSELFLTNALVGIVVLPLWRLAALYFSKQWLYGAAALIAGTTCVSWYLATPEEAGWAFYLRAGLLGLSASGTLLMALSMLPDTIENDFHRTGLRREGIYAAIFEFSQKAAYALGPFIIGIFLQLNGYESSNGKIVAQSPGAVHAVMLSMSVLPGLAYVVALTLLTFYKLPPRPEASNPA